MIVKLKPKAERLSCPQHGPYNTMEDGRRYEVVQPIEKGVYQLDCYSYCELEHPLVPAIKVKGATHWGLAPVADLIFPEEGGEVK